MHKILLVFVIIFLVGCSQKLPFNSSTPYYIVMKNNQIAVADTGFIKKDENRLNLQLFSASTPVFDLYVEDNICVEHTCVSKTRFNREFFGTSHYDDFLVDMLNLRPIYDKKNFKKTQNGFEQKIKTENFDITYKVDNGNLYFKDRQNKILIKLRELK